MFLTIVLSLLISFTERIRVEAPGEADWWKEEDPEDMEVTTEDTWLSSFDDSADGGKNKSMDSGSTGSAKKFHNCGLETWEAARAAWTATPTNNSHKSNRTVDPPSQRELGRIISKASSLRTCELPRRTPLKNLVESYVMVWNGDDF